MKESDGVHMVCGPRASNGSMAHIHPGTIARGSRTTPVVRCRASGESEAFKQSICMDASCMVPIRIPYAWPQQVDEYSSPSLDSRL